MFQIEVWKLQESFTYFKIFKPISWDKRPAERRSRFIQRFPRPAVFAAEGQVFLPSYAKPPGLVIARRARAPDAAIFNDALCRSVTKYGRAERCSISHVFCDRDFFLLRAPVLRHGMLCLWLKDCRGRSAASQ